SASLAKSGKAGCASQRRFNLPQMVEGLLAEKSEYERVAAFGQLRSGGGVADHADGCFEAAFPSRARGVSDQQPFGRKAGCDEHGARDALEIDPTRGDSHQVFGV